VQKKKYISLGPFCLSASILKSAKLRDGSYPLDWAQSGYTTIKELVELSKEAFYFRNIYTPSIHFYQTSTKNTSQNDMFPLISSVDTNIFGYPYFYNPHKRLGAESKEYHLRTLTRWENATSTGSSVTFLLTDYCNNPGNIFFDDSGTKLIALSRCLSENLACEHRIILIRLRLSEDSFFIYCSDFKYLNHGIAEIIISYPRFYQATQELHDMGVDMIAAVFNYLLRKTIDRDLEFIPGQH
jgi:hypothetical protein